MISTVQFQIGDESFDVGYVSVKFPSVNRRKPCLAYFASHEMQKHLTPEVEDAMGMSAFEGIVDDEDLMGFVEMIQIELELDEDAVSVDMDGATFTDENGVTFRVRFV